MALIKRTPKPDPTRLYEAVQSFSAPAGTFPAGYRLTGDHEAVRAHFGAWMLADLPDDEKSRIRGKAMWGHGETPEHSRHAPPPVAQPPSGRYRAAASWTLPDVDLQHRAVINVGELVNADDEVYKRYPHLFVPHIEER